MRGMRYLVAWALAWPVLAWAQSTAPVATLDRPRIGEGETVTLNIEVGEGGSDLPDMAPLAQDFIVLGTSTNRSLSIVNGRREAHTILGIALRPRRDGHLTVPALVIGSQRTQPLELDVQPAGSGGGPANADRPVVLEGKPDPQQAYVGQQIDYTLRLYFAVNLADGQLGDPAAEGAEVRRIGQDANYQTMRGGRRFNVVERHYAIFPQKPGTLEIQPPAFQGTAVDPNDMGAFFGSGDPVNAVAQRTTVEVRPRPAGAADGAWIPARSLKLALDGLPADGKATVGQPLTLTMRLDAVGMPFEALPALSLPSMEGADVYPDKAVTGGATSGPWVTGRRQQGFAVVPTRAGRLHIPETTLHWWNVTTDKAEVATIPAHDIDVAAGGGSTSGSPTAARPVASPQAVAAAPQAATTSVASASWTFWRWAFAGMVVLWLLTLLAWGWSRRRRAAALPAASEVPQAPVRDGPAREAFKTALTQGDAAVIEHSLLAWARAVRPSVRSLGALTTQLREGPQREAVAMLQRARFGGGELHATVLRDAFVNGLDWTVPASAKSGNPLPPLYPR